MKMLSLHLVNFHHRRTGNSRLQAGEIHWLQKLMGSETISKYNPFDYLDDEEEEDDDLYGEEE